MQDRRPRKLKKRLKSRFSKSMALRVAQISVTNAITSVALARISACSFPASGFKTKKEAVMQMVDDHAKTIGQILNDGPKNWREA